MTFLEGIKSWFSKKESPYSKILLILERIESSLNILQAESLTLEGKFRRDDILNEARNYMLQYNQKFEKIGLDQKLLLIKNNPDLNEFFTKSPALLKNFDELIRLFKKEQFNEVKIKELINFIKNDLNILKNLAKDIDFYLKNPKPIPQIPFNKKEAKDPFNIQGRTADGFSISKIVKLAKGLGFKVVKDKKASSHNYYIYFNDGEEPCALADSTNYYAHLRNKFANNSGRKVIEVDKLLRAV